MTYCLAAIVDDGLAFVSDSRTNAGIDQLGVFSKMHPFLDLDGRFFALLSAGNLATTQAVIATLRQDIRKQATPSLATAETLREAADYVGSVSRKTQEKYAKSKSSDKFSPEADFIFGGQIGDAKHGLFHIYAQGNYVAPTSLAPFVQIGEQKYGKPILDRIVQSNTDLETVARCGLVSMDSTMRSNASVGPPVELLIYYVNRRRAPVHLVFDENDPYLRAIRDAWAENLRKAFENLPPLELPEAKVRLVDR